MKLINFLSFIKKRINFKTGKDIIKRAICLVLVFLLINCFVLIINNILFFIYKDNFNNKIYDTEMLFQKEFLQFLELSRGMAAFPEFVEMLKGSDVKDIKDVIDSVKEKEDILSVTVIDNEGRIVFGVDDAENSEDYIFQAIKWKDQILEGKIFSSFDVRGSNMIEMVVGQPIMDNDKVIGGLVINRKVDDGYINYFKDKYLGKNLEIGVFIQNEGIVETSFNNSETEKIFSANIDIDIQRASDIFLSKSNNSLFLNGQEYFVDKLYLEELNTEDGAILLFYRFDYFSKFIVPSLVSAFLLFLIFVLSSKFKGKYLINCIFFGAQAILSKGALRGRVLFLLFIILLVCIIVMNNILYYGFYHPGIKLKQVYEYKIYNSVLKFDPEYSAIDINNRKKVAISLLSGGEAINVVRVAVNYDPKKVFVEEIITDNSFCKSGKSSMFIEREIDNEKGLVSIVCGVPNPGFSGDKGILAELLLRPLDTGQFSLRFGPETQVLANDGLGTDVLRNVIDSSYFVSNFGGSGDEDDRIFLFSYTHPNSETWYRNKKIDLFWRADWASEYYYSLDNEPFSIPDWKNETKENYISFNPKDDGIYYFHIGGVKEGVMRSVYHYKVKIDSSPPEYLHLKVNNRVINKGEIVRAEFESMDKVSGVEPNLFYIKLDDSIYLPTKSPLYIPFNKAGNHTIHVKSYDRADNYLEDSLEIKVKNTPFVKNFINIFVK